jgi:thiol:disulfide interchange protein DsbC
MKTRFLLLCAVVSPLMACSSSVGAPVEAAPQSSPAITAAAVKAGDPRIALAAKIPGAKPEDLRATPVPGIFELVHGTDISYVSADAKYVFSGDLYQVTEKGDFPNLSEARRRELEQPQWQSRTDRLAKIPESDMLIFGPADAKHTITVFTDIDCPWCRKLHEQIADYNKLGIRVRYLFYPRSGPDTESWHKAEAVWCAKDRNQALTLAKRDKPFDAKRCAGTPVARDYKLGREFNLSGTPGIVLETGELVPGYLAPRDLLAHIEGSIARAAKRSN